MESLSYKLVPGILSLATLISPVTASSASQFGMDDVLSWFKPGNAQKITKIEDLVEKIPASFKSSFVLLYKSASSQDATPSAPRVLLFGENAKFVLAYNGDPKARGYYNVEMEEFREDTKTFEFRELTFPENPDAPDAKVKVSEANPAKCKECHRQDLRPNWEPYNTWPGLYGSNGGFITASSPAVELNGFVSFIRDYASNPRYRALGDIHSAYRDTSSGLNKSFALDRVDPFTEQLTQWNYRRIARLMQATPGYPDFKYAIAAALGCPEPFDDALPAELKAIFDPRKPIRFEAGGYNSQIRNMDYLFEPRGISTKEWAMEFGTGGRLSFSSRFGTPGYPQQEFLAQVLLADAELTPYAKYTTYAGYSTTATISTTDCSRLKELSISHLRNYLQTATIPTPALPATVTDPSLERMLHDEDSRTYTGTESYKSLFMSRPSMLRTCLNCHDGANPDIPRIYFESDQVLKAQMKKTGYEHGTLGDEILFRLSGSAGRKQMPPSGDVNAQDYEELKSYLTALRARAR